MANATGLTCRLLLTFQLSSPHAVRAPRHGWIAGASEEQQKDYGSKESKAKAHIIPTSRAIVWVFPSFPCHYARPAFAKIELGTHKEKGRQDHLWRKARRASLSVNLGDSFLRSAASVKSPSPKRMAVLPLSGTLGRAALWLFRRANGGKSKPTPSINWRKRGESSSPRHHEHRSLHSSPFE